MLMSGPQYVLACSVQMNSNSSNYMYSAITFTHKIGNLRVGLKCCCTCPVILAQYFVVHCCCENTIKNK